MKTKLIMLTAAAVLGATALWLATPQQLNATETNAVSRKILYYTCPMHPLIKSDKPGDCPQCGMVLRPVCANASSTNAPSLSATNRPATKMPGCGSPGGCCR
jgi:hypothetical protein